ncbi:MAG: hypothetical protein Q8922_09810 [Bacteroidota bacterium]|nr:hypothetical protein [Bacteroidota bacterium]MDP4232850.1 hypothetical protein [Bacteroidota bacterium]MDP4241894.1 hypothetical protein [Bacteroidota bacterium]MDP4288219.1 hypothetical protein [Bacteroidota bacterium]
MKTTVLVILASLMALVGVIWIGQGIGWIGGSFMTNQTRWAVIGTIMILVAAGMLWFALSRKA